MSILVSVRSDKGTVCVQTQEGGSFLLAEGYSN